MFQDIALEKVSHVVRRAIGSVDRPMRRCPGRSSWTVPLATLLLLIPTGCDKGPSRGTAPTFEERRAMRPWTTATSLETGRKLHRERCLTCHGEAPRELYTPARWREIVDAMAERSRLDTIQSTLVLDWILVGDSAPGVSTGER